jgi:antitoxin CptB
MKELERVRWRCRRGLLELDIVLGRFVERHYATLDEAGILAFDELLDMPDTLLWDMIAGRGEPPQESSQLAVLELLQAA